MDEIYSIGNVEKIYTILFGCSLVKQSDFDIQCKLGQFIPKKFSRYDVGQIKYSLIDLDYNLAGIQLSSYEGLTDTKTSFINGVLSIELFFEWNIVGRLEPGFISRGWKAIYSIYEDIENKIFKYYGFDFALRSLWQSPISLVELSEVHFFENQGAIVNYQKQMFSTDEKQNTLVLGEIILGSTWDGTLVFVNADKVERSEIVFLFLMTCLDWSYFDMSKLSLLNLVSNKSNLSSEVVNTKAHDVISRFYFDRLKVDPYFLCYDERDIRFILALQQSWGRDDMANKSLQSFSEAKQAFSFIFQTEHSKMLKLAAKRQDFLNLIVSLVGIISIAGTVATVFMFFDFRNNLFNLGYRIFFVCFACLSFSMWVWVFLKKLKNRNV